MSTKNGNNRSFIVSGLGAMGRQVADALVDRGWTLAGAVDVVADDQKKEWLAQRAPNAHLFAGISDVPERSARLCVLTTNSMLAEVAPQVKAALDLGMNVLSSAEELAYPWARQAELAEELNRYAEERGLAVLGTGINPGFMMDILPICLSVACIDVESISVQRTNDLSAFGPSVLRSFGVGLSEEEFHVQMERGDVVGHVGFAESIQMIASGVGLTFDRIEETAEPIIAQRRRSAASVLVEPGLVVGCVQIATAYREGVAVISLRHPQQIDPLAEGVETGDHIIIRGRPSIEMRISPEVAGGTGTVALLANTAEYVASDGVIGLRSMLDVPLQRLRPAKE